MVTLKINGKEHSYDEDATYEKVVADYQAEYDNLITLVVENGKLKELFRKPKDGAEISFITRKDDMGRKAYQRTVILIMVKAIDDVLGGDKSKYVKVEFAIGKGYYVSPKGGLEITEEFLRKVEARMKEIVAADLPIVKKTYSIDDAVKLFADNGMMDKVKLFKYRRSSSVNVYELDGYPDYFYGYMLPRTSYAPYFDLVKYDEGFMLVMPDKKNLHGVPEYEPL